MLNKKCPKGKDKGWTVKGKSRGKQEGRLTGRLRADKFPTPEELGKGANGEQLGRLAGNSAKLCKQTEKQTTNKTKQKLAGQPREMLRRLFPL